MWYDTVAFQEQKTSEYWPVQSDGGVDWMQQLVLVKHSPAFRSATDLEAALVSAKYSRWRKILLIVGRRLAEMQLGSLVTAVCQRWVLRGEPGVEYTTR